MKTRFVTVAVKKYLDAPYCLGGKTPEQGLDCLSLLRCVFWELGIDLPDSFGDFTLANYAEKWAEGEGREELKKYICSLGEEVGLNYITVGDVLLIKEDSYFVPVIYLGNRNILIALEDYGVKVVPINAVNPVKAIRII